MAKYRRIVCEAAIARRGYKTFPEVAEACEKKARQLGVDATFNSYSIQHYVGDVGDLSAKRLRILAQVLGVRDVFEIDERYKIPEVRNAGHYFEGEFGGRIKDMQIDI